jgi:hypothetical protein
MGMMLGAALAAIPLAILHHRSFPQLAVAVLAGAFFFLHILHGQTPFSWSSKCGERRHLKQ